MERWMYLLQFRPRLVALARHLGAGEYAKDIAQETLLRAVSHVDFDESRGQAFLSVVAARLTVDLHRSTARLRRVHILMSCLPTTETMEEEVIDREEARHAARLLDTEVPLEVQRLLMQRADGVSWQALATEHGESVRALETRVRRAVIKIRRQVREWPWRNNRESQKIMRRLGIANRIEGERFLVFYTVGGPH